MPKNIIICCDGTDNKLTLNKNSNVVHLYSCLQKDKEQLTYYHPGVGTLAPSGIKKSINQIIYKGLDKIAAFNMENHVKKAYLFLMDNYEDGDKIYLFGFSRGAYTVRMLSGLIEMFGLLQKGNFSHLEYAFEIYSQDDNKFSMAKTYKSRFSRDVKIHFIGIWDTVVSIGWLTNFYKSFPYSRSLGIAKTVRHALSVDERRKHFYYYEVSEKHKDCREVFFAGVHADVGGSYQKEGLSKIALEWMMGEASEKGLLLEKAKVDYYVYGKRNVYQKPDHKQKINKSLTLFYKLCDFIPRLRYSEKSRFKNMKVDYRLWPLREIRNDASIHDSVFKKINDCSDYRPANIANPNSYTIIASKPIQYPKAPAKKPKAKPTVKKAGSIDNNKILETTPNLKNKPDEKNT